MGSGSRARPMYVPSREIYPVTKKEEHIGRGARLGVIDSILHYRHRPAGLSEVGRTCVLHRINRGFLTTHRRFSLGLGVPLLREHGPIRRLKLQPTSKSG